MTFNALEYLLIMNFAYFVPIFFNLPHDYITLKYKRCQKSPYVFRVMTFKTPEMTFRTSENNDTLFYCVQY